MGRGPDAWRNLPEQPARVGDLLALDPDVGSGDAFPEGGARQRPKGLYAPRPGAVGADDRVILRVGIWGIVRSLGRDRLLAALTRRGRQFHS